MESTATQDSFFNDIYETSATTAYAGFWFRLVAWFIDAMVHHGRFLFTQTSVA